MNQQKLPNATASLVLGILSIVTCFCYGIFGIILGIIGLTLAMKDTKLYNENPSGYDNYGNVKIGKILSIIGIILSILFLVYVIWIISIIGTDALQDPELMKERLNEYFGV